MTQRNDMTHGAEEVASFGLRDLLAALRNRWRMIAVLTVIGATLAALFALSLPNRYEAVATVQIDPRKKTIISVDAVLPDIAGDTPTIESQVEILHSKVIALRVIEALGLRNDPEFISSPFLLRLRRIFPFLPQPKPAVRTNNGEADRIANAKAVQSIAGPTQGAIGNDDPGYDDIAAEFSDRLRTWRVRNSLIVEIHFAANDPAKAARIANTIAEVYIRDQIEAKIKATELASELLQQKIAGLRQKVTDAELKVTHFKAENSIFDTGKEPLAERELARLMEQTMVSRNAASDARARYEQLQRTLTRGDGSNVGEVLQSHTIRMLKEQLVRATRREAELLTKYGPRHPELIRARADLADVEAQLRHEMTQIIQNVKNEYEVAAKRQQMLESNLESLKTSQSSLQNELVKLRDLERDATSSRQVLDAFLARYKQTTETQGLHLPDARIVEKADIPTSPAGPKRKQLTLVGLFAGLAVGMAIAVLLQFLSSGLTSAEDTETAIGAPHLASIPLLRRRSDGMDDPGKAARKVVHEPNGQFSRAVLGLASQMAGTKHDDERRIILMASALPNEGKTVVAANLALALARSGTRTLLIDADLRRSALSQQLGLSEMPGLLDAIVHGQAFETALRRDAHSGLVVLPAGGANLVGLTAREALEAPGFGHRLSRLKAYFDVILIDVPPMLPVSDAAILAEFADQIVIVTAWQRTPKDLLRRAVATLGGNAAKVMGVVINQVETKSNSLVKTKTKGNRRSEDRRAA